MEEPGSKKKRKRAKEDVCGGQKSSITNQKSGKKMKDSATIETDTKKEGQVEEDSEELRQVGKQLAQAKRVLVLVGAGISRSCGLPDFRSSSGIYQMVQSMGLDIPQPECLFDKDYFLDDPTPFYQFAHILYPSVSYRPSLTHRFLLGLEKVGKLLRVYTQNIDGLESQCGVKRVVTCHGTLEKAKCASCNKTYDPGVVREAASTRTVAKCDKPRCSGAIRPGITFFGEPVAPRARRMLDQDTEKADLVLVIGTSLQVAPMSAVPHVVNVPRVLINMNPVRMKKGQREFDSMLLGDCDTICARLVRAMVSNMKPAAAAKVLAAVQI